MLRKLLILTFILAFSSPAFSAEAIMRQIPNAEVVGEARLSVAFWDVYDATLYAPKGELHSDKPFALSLLYLREIKGSDIADPSVKEMRDQGFRDEKKLAAWHTEMNAIFPNVEDGTLLSAVFIPKKETIFYHANKPIGVVKDPEFTKRFADIWLGEKSSEPLLRRKLLGIL